MGKRLAEKPCCIQDVPKNKGGLGCEIMVGNPEALASITRQRSFGH